MIPDDDPAEARLLRAEIHARRFEDQGSCESARSDTGTFVYFIESGPRGPIKVGHALFPQNRLNALQSSNPVPLRIVRLVYGGRIREQAIHRQFKALRIHGEWFRRTKQLLDYIVSAPEHDFRVYEQHLGRNFYTEPRAVLTNALENLIFHALPMTPARRSAETDLAKTVATDGPLQLHTP